MIIDGTEFKINMDDPHNKIMTCSKEFKVCKACKMEESSWWFFCMQNKCLYCFRCHNFFDRSACKGAVDHDDICIHKVVIE